MTHVPIVAGGNDDGLFARNPFGHVVLVNASVELPRLERVESGRPFPFVRVLHQFHGDGRGTSTVEQSAFYYRLKRSVGCRNHATPTGYSVGERRKRKGKRRKNDKEEEGKREAEEKERDKSSKAKEIYKTLKRR